MKRISFWAREHKHSARVIIVFFYLLLHFTGLFLGDIVHSFNIQFTPLFNQVAIVMTLLGFILYPSKNRKHQYKNFFARQKLADFILVCATFLFIVYAGNALNSNQNTFRNRVHAATIVNSNSYTNVGEPSTAKSSVSKKSLRKKIREEIKRVRKAYKVSPDALKTLYITLAILGALFLGAGIAFLGCHIACTGSEALGAVVMYGGTAGIIFFLIRIIKRIKRGHPKIRKS